MVVKGQSMGQFFRLGIDPKDVATYQKATTANANSVSVVGKDRLAA